MSAKDERLRKRLRKLHREYHALLVQLDAHSVHLGTTCEFALFEDQLRDVLNDKEPRRVPTIRGA